MFEQRAGQALAPKLIGRDIVVFDLEIKNEIGKNGVTWDTYEKMGISVGVSFSFRTLEYRIFMDDNIADLAEQLNQAELAVGFNILGFDLPLLNATVPGKLKPRAEMNVYDMLEQSRISMGWDPGKRYDKYPVGLKLDNHLRGTFGDNYKKTEAGADAPLFWQRGQLGRLVSYCVADVKRECSLFRHVWDRGEYTTDTHGTRPAPKHPREWLAATQ